MSQILQALCPDQILDNLLYFPVYSCLFSCVLKALPSIQSFPFQSLNSATSVFPATITSNLVFVTQLHLFVTPWTAACQAPHPWNSPSKNTGMCCHFLLRGIFLTQGSNLGLLHCRQILYHLSHQGSPASNLSDNFLSLIGTFAATPFSLFSLWQSLNLFDI